jgi:hypothetical protein
MPNPWDRPPLPSKGDDDDDITYAGVGRVVTEWEQVEQALAALYSLLVGRFEDREATREYGEGAVLKGRLERLARVAEGFFVSIRNQDLEGEFDSLLDKVRLYADRRNDIAHGRVWDIEWFIRRPGVLPDPNIRFQFCVVPPDYKGKLFNPNNMPLYVYTRPELNNLQGVFHGFTHEVMQLTWKLRRFLEAKE